MNIQFISKDDDFQNETTNYWFKVKDEIFAVSDTNGELQLLDCDGTPVDHCTDHDGVLELLLPLYQKEI